MQILTLTLNPAFDVHCRAENFALYCETIAEITDYDAGGKGINISRALTKNHIANRALVLLGEENQALFIQKLEQEGLSCQMISLPGRIRENITIHTDHAPETRLSFPGFSVEASVLEQLDAVISSYPAQELYLTVTGSLPKGISAQQLLPFLHRYRNSGIHFVIDSRSFSLEELLACKPWLIKPNEEEIASYSQKQINTPQDAAFAAKKLHLLGIENVILSMGKNGAVLCCTQGCFYAKPPKMDVLSTVGAGDSMIAGFLAGHSQQLPAKKSLALAVAYGSAACLTSGTRPPRSEDIALLLPQISVQLLK